MRRSYLWLDTVTDPTAFDPLRPSALHAIWHGYVRSREPVRLRWPSVGEVVIQGLLVLMLILLVWDYNEALRASACSAPSPERTQNCYPWGMTEGPMEGGSWGYASKANYLRQQLVMMTALAVSGAAPLVASNSQQGVVAAFLIAGAGLLGSEWIARLL